MIETAQTKTHRQAFEAAHKERAEVIRAGARWVRAKLHLPLN